MSEDSDTDFGDGMMDPSPDEEGEVAPGHGYDALFFYSSFRGCDRLCCSLVLLHSIRCSLWMVGGTYACREGRGVCKGSLEKVRKAAVCAVGVG